MRRIHADFHPHRDSKDMWACISKRDYRLMRAVVRAAESSLRDPHFRGVFASSVKKTVDAFNAPEKRK